MALFVYNRPDHTRRTVEALSRNILAAQTDLCVYSDGPKGSLSETDVGRVRRYIGTISGFRSVTITEATTNLGLAGSIVGGVTAMCASHGRVIVMEDDLVTGPWFLTYMNDGLRLYAQEARVASIHGYCYPVREALPETFFMRGADCWGWATWHRSWRDYEADGARLLLELRRRALRRAFDLGGAYGFSQMLAAQVAGKNDSWAIRWHASCFLRDKLTLYPGRSLVQNIGTDGSGTHCGDSQSFDQEVAAGPVMIERIPLEPSAIGERAFAQFLRKMRPSPLRRVVARGARLLQALK